MAKLSLPAFDEAGIETRQNSLAWATKQVMFGHGKGQFHCLGKKPNMFVNSDCVCPLISQR